MEKKQNNFLSLFCVVLAILVGVARGIGGLGLIALGGSTSGTMVGIGLVIVASWLIVAGICCLVKKTPACYKWLIAGIVVFWLDGIINGFVLFGRPQLSGQIINAAMLLLIIFGSYRKIKSDF